RSARVAGAAGGDSGGRFRNPNTARLRGEATAVTDTIVRHDPRGPAPLSPAALRLLRQLRDVLHGRGNGLVGVQGESWAPIVDRGLAEVVASEGTWRQVRITHAGLQWLSRVELERLLEVTGG